MEADKPKRVSPALNWCFTWFGADDTGIQNLIHNSAVKNYAFQEEVCPTSGKDHIQGYVEFKRKVRPAGMFDPRIHWAVRKGTRTQAALYCLKDETRKEGGRQWNSIGELPAWLARGIRTIEGNLRPWQAELEELLLQPPDDRTIHWYWCQVGGSGKTSVMKYLVQKYSWMTGLACCRSADIKTAADVCTGAYLLDFSRTLDGHYPYQAIEELKNGYITEAKLKKEMRVVISNSPHVVCFANTPPDTSRLSGDRWHVVCLD